MRNKIQFILAVIVIATVIFSCKEEELRPEIEVTTDKESYVIDQKIVISIFNASDKSFESINCRSNAVPDYELEKYIGIWTHVSRPICTGPGPVTFARMNPGELKTDTILVSTSMTHGNYRLKYSLWTREKAKVFYSNRFSVE